MTSATNDDACILCAIDECDENRHANACGGTNERVRQNRHYRNDDTARIKFILDSGATEHMVGGDFKQDFD